MMDTRIKRILLQIKTSDKNVNHRFRTHWTTIKHGAFRKIALLNMCRDLGLVCPSRLRKNEIFEKLLTRLVSKSGGALPASPSPLLPPQLHLEHTSPTHTLSSVVPVFHYKSKKPRQITYYDFDNKLRVFSKLKNKENVVQLLTVMNIPGYLVYDTAYAMCHILGSVIFDHSSFTEVANYYVGHFILLLNVVRTSMP